MKKQISVFIALVFCTVGTFADSKTDEPRQSDIFVSGQDGYQTYRIPALLVTKNGSLLAFCEARKNGKSDTGDIDLVLKRSRDGGKTWGKQQVVWNDDANTCGNPCPVVDETTGTIWLLMTHNLGTDNERDIKLKTAQGTRTVWVCQSTDDGKNWSKPVEITAATKDPAWGWYATGPGVGIQIQHGPHQERLVIPCDHSYDDPKGDLRGMPVGYGSHTIYSDDHGKNWKPGAAIHPKVNECQVVELADDKNTLLMDMRSYVGRNRRTQSISLDGGESWSEPEVKEQLIEPVCQASILRYTWPDNGDKSRIIFSNPADEKRRRNLTVRLSYDEGKTWPVAKTLHKTSAAYSCLAVLPDKSMACLYECGDKNAYEKITFAQFTLDWLTDGKDSSTHSDSRTPSPHKNRK